MNLNLNNKIALVTGASRGIGQAIALQLAENGATVIGTATTDAGAQKITAYFEEKQLPGRGMVLNVAEADSVENFMSTLEKEDSMPNILVNNAAVTRDNLLLRMDDEEWDKVINTDLTSLYRMSKACLKSMMRARWGRIINITSVVALSGNPGQSNYAAAKAGMIGFGKSLAQEMGSRGVTVNSVAPGFIDTDMTRSLPESARDALLGKIPLKRLGNTDDIAHAVCFLASDCAGYITGETLNINGGMYMA